MVWKWRDYEGILAKLVPKEMVKGLIKQDIVVRPGEEVVIIRNGKIEDSVTQTRLEKVGGGLGNWIRKKFGVGEDLELLFIDTKETDLEIGIDERSSDHDEVKGTCTLRLRIDPTKSTQIISLMRAFPQSERDIDKAFEKPIDKKFWKKKKHLFGLLGKEDWYAGMVLLNTDLSEKLEGELKSKVLQETITNYPSNEIRGNPEIREKLETQIGIELRKTFDMWGLQLLNFYTTFDSGAYDALEKHRRQVNITIEEANIDSLPEFMDNLRDIEQDHKLEKTNIQNTYELKNLGVLDEEDVKDIRQERNLDRQKQLLDHRKAERENTLEEHVLDMKELFGEEYLKKYGVPGTLDVKDRMEQWKRAREQHSVDMRIKEYQETDLAREKIRADVEKETARLDAEKAKYNIETYERGISKERELTSSILDKSAKMMESAKQDLPRTFVQGGRPTPVISVNDTVKEDSKISGVCSNCQTPLKNEWKVCPHCGTEINK